MKKVLHISISVLLSVFILVSGSGLIIGKMVCLKSGYVVLDAKEVKDCCVDGSQNGTFFNDACCDINNISFQQNHFLTENNITLKSPVAVELFHFAQALQISFVNSSLQKDAIVYPDPPMDNRVSTVLPFLGVFRI